MNQSRDTLAYKAIYKNRDATFQPYVLNTLSWYRITERNIFGGLLFLLIILYKLKLSITIYSTNKLNQHAGGS